MSRFCFCNCPAGFSAAPERHAPDCPGRSGAGKPRAVLEAPTKEALMYPLDVVSVGSDTYIVMSKGHHDFTEFMTEAVTQYHGWFLGGPQHVWIKTTPTKGGCNYNIVKEGTRGAWPATYCWEYADDYKEWQKLAVTP